MMLPCAGCGSDEVRSGWLSVGIDTLVDGAWRASSEIDTLSGFYCSLTCLSARLSRVIRVRGLAIKVPSPRGPVALHDLGWDDGA